MVVFNKEDYKIGDFVKVLIKNCTSATLIGEVISYSKNINGIIYTNNQTTLWNNWK